MVISESEEGLSAASVSLLCAVAATRIAPDSAGSVPKRDLVRYIAGVLSSQEAQTIEEGAVARPTTRYELSKALSLVEIWSNTPYWTLRQRLDGTGEDRESLLEWISVLENHVRVVSEELRGTTPTTWSALSKLSKQGADGYLAARTIWCAFFSTANLTSGPLQLGFGYRRSSVGSTEPLKLFTRVEGSVLESGDLEIFAEAKPGTTDGAVYFGFSHQGRALPLAEGMLINGQVKLTVDGLGGFLRLPIGSVSRNSLSARFDDWTDECKLGQILVQPWGGTSPSVEPPAVIDGQLALPIRLEDPHLEGPWELLLAVTPNCWQMLAHFDIKCEFGRRQVLSADLPGTVREGPFGGALWLRRQLPR